MQELSASRGIRATPETISDIIVNIAELPDWNPALTRVETSDRIAVIDHPYAVSTRIPGRATLTYVQAGLRRIVWRLEVAGSTETGEWVLERSSGQTRVTHTMSHHGALFALMHRSMRAVPAWRLDRLQERAESAATRIPKGG